MILNYNCLPSVVRLGMIVIISYDGKVYRRATELCIVTPYASVTKSVSLSSILWST